MKKLLLTAICLLSTLTVSGCSTLTLNEYSRDIAKLELVQTIGVDVGGEGTRVTAGIKDINNMKAISAQAASVAGALQRLHSQSAKERVYLAHTRHYIIGEEAARSNVGEYLDFIERDMDMRINTPVFIVKGAKAEDVMSYSDEQAEAEAEVEVQAQEGAQAEAGGNALEGGSASDVGGGEKKDIASTLETLEQSNYLLSGGYVFTCSDVARNLIERGCALVAAIEPTDGTDATAAVPAGYAVINEGRLVDFIDTELVGGVNIFMKGMNPDILEIQDSDGNTIAFKISVASVDYRPVYEGYDLKSAAAEVALDANIAQVSGELDIYNSETITDLENRISQKMLEMGREVINMSQELGADFLNFGKKNEIVSPIKFSKMDRPWEEVFGELDIDLRVTTKIERTYDLLEPVSANGDSYGQ